MDGFVPLSREDIHAGCVPPVQVELTVGEAGQLGKSVADAFKHDVEDEQVVDHHRHRELQEGAEERCISGRSERHDPVLGDDVDDEERAECCQSFFEHVERADRLQAWVGEFIDEGGDQKIVPEVGVADVARPHDRVLRNQLGGGRFGWRSSGEQVLTKNLDFAC